MTFSNGISIPVLDFSEFTAGSISMRQQCADKILEAFTTVGFVYLSNALPQETIDQAFSLSREFFALPVEEKMKVEWESFVGKRGFVMKGFSQFDSILMISGREQIFDPDDMVVVRHDGKFNKAPTMKLHQSIKESFELGREPSLNQFPADWPEFKQFWENFYRTCNILYLEVLSALALGFGLLETYFEHLCNNGDNTLKTMHYPPVPTDLKGVRMMAHTDLEIVTLLLQDTAGGLELKNTAGEWVKAQPVPGCVTVNAGDLLMRWSNRKIKSTMHRVCPPPIKPKSRYYPSRYSVAFFAGPNPETNIEALPGTFATESDKLYPVVNTREFIGGGFKDLYGGERAIKEATVEA